MKISTKKAVNKVVLDVARFSPLPIGKFGASKERLANFNQQNDLIDSPNGRKDQVDIRPPMFPIITVVPIAADRAVSETTLAEDCALQSAPKENAPRAIRNDAPYRACGFSVARKIMYPIIMNGAEQNMM